MNSEHVERIKTVLRANASLYNQSKFHRRTDCGTECCIAGWSYIEAMGAVTVWPGVNEICEVAANWLGIPYESQTALVLFGGALFWPSQFSFMEDDAPDFKVYRACAFLDYLVAGGYPVDE